MTLSLHHHTYHSYTRPLAVSNTIIYHPIKFSFFFNDTATTEIYTLSLHDALPISDEGEALRAAVSQLGDQNHDRPGGDRKSTRLNSSHRCISYAVFCLKKKNKRYKLHQH